MKPLTDIKQSEIDEVIRYIHEHWREHGSFKDGMSEQALAEFYIPLIDRGLYGVRHRMLILVSLGYVRKVKSFSGSAAYVLTEKALERLKEIYAAEREHRSNQPRENEK